MRFAQLFFSAETVRNISNVALNNRLACFIVNTADELDIATFAVLGLEGQIVVTDVTALLEFAECLPRRFRILKQSDFPEFFTEKLFAGIPKQIQYERIYFDDFPGCAVEYKDSVLSS